MTDNKALKADELQSGGFFGSMFGNVTPEPVKEEKKPQPDTKKEEEKVKKGEKKEVIQKESFEVTESDTKEQDTKTADSSVSAADLLQASEQFGNAKVVRSAPPSRPSRSG
ncbi:MAG: hypothetical protein H6766_02210 [Candidatus Peribacteria bacterium]|nr:MAG: hypothetical protein H6766_02210 [Candidatus Peribacteria bacterium]